MPKVILESTINSHKSDLFKKLGPFEAHELKIASEIVRSNKSKTK